MSAPRLSQPSSIARRLAGFSVIFVTAAVIVASVILYLIVADVVRRQIDQRLDTQVDALRGALVQNAAGDIVLSSPLDSPPFDRPGSGWYWQISGDQVHLTSLSLANHGMDRPPLPFDWRQLFTAAPRPSSDSDFNGEALHIRTLTAIVAGRQVDIIASAPQSALSAPAQRALFWLVPAMLLLGMVLVAGIMLQVRYGLRPLRQLTSDIAAISAGSLPRLPDTQEKDLRPVSEEINRLVDQNSRRLAETRLHFANLAHGLKTPVASLALALDAGNDPDHELRALVTRIDQRIRHHLARARKTSAGGANSTASVKPRVDDLVLVMSRIHADRGITADCTIPADLSVACDPDDFDEILGNLIDNAFKWAGEKVRIGASAEEGMVVLTIDDDGPGISETVRADAFLPGVRLDETVPGDGFGLTIANELVQLYGGSIRLENGGKGLLQTITLPKS